jgi:hypothetical protein
MVAIESSDNMVDLRNKDREGNLPASKPRIKCLINHQYQRVYRKKEPLRNLCSIMRLPYTPFNVILNAPSTGSGQALGAKNLVVGRKRYLNSENEILRSAQDDIKLGIILEPHCQAQGKQDMELEKVDRKLIENHENVCCSRLPMR